MKKTAKSAPRRRLSSPSPTRPYSEASPRFWSEQVECTSPDQAPSRALGSHRGISNKTRWAAAAFSPKKLTEHKWGGRRPSPHALCLCHPAGFLCNNTLLFVEQQQDRTNRLSSHSSLPLHPSPQPTSSPSWGSKRKWGVLLLLKAWQVPPAGWGHFYTFRHSDAEAFVLHGDKHDSVYSQSKNCTLRQNNVYVWRPQWGSLHSCRTGKNPSGTNLYIQ